MAEEEAEKKDDEELNLDTEEKQDQTGGMSTKKLIIIMSAGFALVLTIIVVVLVLLLGGSDSSSDQDQEQVQETSEAQTEDNSAAEPVVEEVVETPGASETKGQAVYYTIRPPFVVNFQTTRKAKYLQISVDVMARDDDVIDAVMDNLPLIKNDLVALFSRQKYEDISTAEGKEKLRQDAISAIQMILKREIGYPGIEEVLFTSFVMQ